jgi:integrase
VINLSQKVLTIRQAVAEPPSKTVAANQKAVDALPLDSGTWRVEGIPGLYVRARKESKSYILQRRVRGALVKRTLGEMPLKAARNEAAREWLRMRPRPAGARLTFGGAFEEYMQQRDLAPKSRQNYEYNVTHYLSGWKDRALEDIGGDRAGVRTLYHALAKNHGRAAAAQVIKLVSAVYNHSRKVDLNLPESPTVAVDLPAIKPRDWGMSRDELIEWWQGVSMLGPIKRTWWSTALLTGARAGSVEALEWTNIDWEKRTIRFGVAKGGRPYIVPAADRLIGLLAAYRDGGEVPPSRYVFPSPMKPGEHLKQVRDDKSGIKSPHHLRHTFRTTLAELGIGPDQCKLLMGHSMGGDISRGYITAPLLVESLRPVTNAVAEHYAKILGW